LVFDGVRPSSELRAAIAGADHLLISAAPGETGDPVLAALRADIAAAPKLRSIVYLSSLSVYGDHGGTWIDESAPTIPKHARGAARVDAECAWQELGRSRDTPVAILRLAGIYGPGQNAFTRLQAGRAHRIDKPGHVFNRIHVADIAQAIDAAFERGIEGAFNVTDDEPTPQGVPLVFAAELLGIPPPAEVAFAEAAKTMTPMALSFYGESKRVRNGKLKRDLGVTLRYPTYREGLRALFAAGEGRSES
jgi:nucleoside-diphosphate-sugar epimerase